MKGIKSLLMFAFALAIMAVMLLMDIPTFMKIKRGQIKDYNTVAAGSLKEGDPVRGTIDTSFGACAEQYETKFGIRTSSGSKKQYYVLWMDNEQLILYETGNQEEYETLDQITDQTADYFDSLEEAEEKEDPNLIRVPSETMEFEGVVKEPSSEIMGYFEEYYKDLFDTGFESKAEKLMISRHPFDSYTVSIWIGLGCAAVSVILLVVTAVVYTKRKKADY